MEDSLQAQRPLETFLTLILEDAHPGLAGAHRELYPARIPERIPFSLTLLYPWIAPVDLTSADAENLRAFFATRSPLDFALVRVAEFPGAVVYAVPEPDDELRSIMRALWELYPEYPPYGRHGNDPPPHATLGELTGEHAITLDQARKRVAPLLPARCAVREVTLMEEYEPDRCRVRETFALGSQRAATVARSLNSNRI